MSQQDSLEHFGHPLFAPKDEDDDPPKVDSIQVFRMEGTQRVMVPKHFAPNEIQDEAQIFNMFGGGTYELVARGPRANGGQCITAKRGFTLPGPSKPLYDDGGKSKNGEPVSTPVQAATTVQQTTQQGQPSWLPVMVALMPMLLQWLQGQQESARADRNAQQALLTAMMKQGQDANAQMMTLMATLNRPSGGSAESFQEGMKFMQEFVSGQLEAKKAEAEANGGDDEIMKTIQSLSTFAELINTMNKDSSPPIQTPPVVEVPPT